MAGHEAYMTEARDERGRWTSGDGSKRPTLLADASQDGAGSGKSQAGSKLHDRMQWAIDGSVGHLPAPVRARINATLDRGAGADLNLVLRALASGRDSAGAHALTNSEVRQKFEFSSRLNDQMLEHLRAAAQAAGKAQTVTEMAAASTKIAQVLQDIGPDNLNSTLHAARVGVDNANRKRLIQLLQDEAGNGPDRPAMEPIGHTVLNRMTRNDTVLVSDVADQYAKLNLPIKPLAVSIADGLLSGSSPDVTGGATHFYSPMGMPREGNKSRGGDRSGGLESVPDVIDTGKQPERNFRPGFSNDPDFKEVLVPGVDPFVAKFYVQTRPGPVR